MPITRSGYAQRAPHSQRYPHAHRRIRKLIADQMSQGIAFRCSRCKEPIEVGQRWHLDHSSDRQTYLGPAHERCNASAGNVPGPSENL